MCELWGDHPANYTKCQQYITRVERLEERKKKPEPKRYIQAPLPKISAWDRKAQIDAAKRRHKDDFPALPSE